MQRSSRAASNRLEQVAWRPSSPAAPAPHHRCGSFIDEPARSGLRWRLSSLSTALSRFLGIHRGIFAPGNQGAHVERDQLAVLGAGGAPPPRGGGGGPSAHHRWTMRWANPLPRSRFCHTRFTDSAPGCSLVRRLRYGWCRPDASRAPITGSSLPSRAAFGEIHGRNSQGFV